MPTVAVGADSFLIDGSATRVISGAIHYWRVHPDQWESRVAWAKHLGLNTVETYVPWHLHEPVRGQRRFEGALDLVRFLEVVHRAGLYAIVRPGPYICAETDLGGLPAWLLAGEEVRLRSTDSGFLAPVEEWFDALVPVLAPLQLPRGGPVILVQIENELGAHLSLADEELRADGPDYLDWLARSLVARGVEVPLVTSDQPLGDMLRLGGHPSALRTVNFGEQAKAGLAALRAIQPDGPLMVMELWDGWYSFWKGSHQSRPAHTMATELDDVLAAGASVNLYMFHGGTNFGFTNGANHDGPRHDGEYRAIVTSYDYDAPLSEDGRPTDKFWAFREVIERYAEVPAADAAPPLPPRMDPATIVCAAGARLTEQLPGQASLASLPVRFEGFVHPYGLLAFVTQLDEPGEHMVALEGLRDRAILLVDDEEAAVLERDAPEQVVTVSSRRARAQLTVILENLGRVNYGPLLRDHKGLAGLVIDGREIQHVSAWSVPLDELAASVKAQDEGVSGEPAGPRWYSGVLDVEHPGDTFVAVEAGTKGAIWVNGFNLGRYWSRGPQRRLFAPGPLLKPGANSVVVLELHAPADTSSFTVSFADAPDLG